MTCLSNWLKMAVVTLMMVSAIVVSGCSSCEEDLPPEALEGHTAIFGGDVLLGRRFNMALYDEGPRNRILGSVAPMLRGADIAVVNAEGVIASGGAFSDKGESRPHMYRAHPHAMSVLVDAGVDLLTVGNNHSGDYGPLALREMLDRTLIADMDYAGAGQNLKDARRPAY
ncbi:MAG: hypothetical protein HN348_27210, partial [Proteobacteria bacterium]|nr:hypothetical protein [Pseudomonadota bacterium]